jgi:hypothetical protein
LRTLARLVLVELIAAVSVQIALVQKIRRHCELKCEGAICDRRVLSRGRLTEPDVGPRWGDSAKGLVEADVTLLCKTSSIAAETCAPPGFLPFPSSSLCVLITAQWLTAGADTESSPRARRYVSLPLARGFNTSAVDSDKHRGRRSDRNLSTTLGSLLRRDRAPQQFRQWRLGCGCNESAGEVMQSGESSEDACPCVAHSIGAKSCATCLG